MWIAILFLLLASPAAGQNGSSRASSINPISADYALMPYSIELPVWPHPGWISASTVWLTAFTPRTHPVGARYRNPEYPNFSRGGAGASMYRDNPVGSISYTCYKEPAFTFRCVDHVRGLTRAIYCPPVAVMANWLETWRSDYQEWPYSNVDWFAWDSYTASRYAVWGNVVHMPVFDNQVTNGTRISCQYQYPDTIEVWLDRR